MSELFGRDIKTVGKHINNALDEELSDTSTAKDSLKVQQNPVVADGKIYQVE
jgi:hypothetical protein